MTRSRSFWRTFWHDERGAVAFMLAPLMIALVGAAAFSIDTLYAVATREQLRTTAEAAVAAGVAKLPDKDAARAAALAYAQANFKGVNPGNIVVDGDIEFGMWDGDAHTFTVVASTDPANALRVSASRTQARGNALQTFFGEALGVATFDLAVTAIAAKPDGGPCIIVLDPSGADAMLVYSNADIDTTCGIHVHSTSSKALVTDSNATIAVTDAEICIRGGYEKKSSSTISPTPTTGCTPNPDPFATVAAPATSGCTYASKVVRDNSSVPLQPGIYCGGLEIKNNSNLTFASGVYVMKDKFSIDGNSIVTGTGVGFYLTGSGALFDFDSNSSVAFSAMSTGPLAGLLLFQDRAFGGTHFFDSNTAATLDGAIYLPMGKLKSDSNAQLGSSSTCLLVVVYQLELNSNSGVNSNPNYSLCTTPPGQRKSRIVA